MADPLGQPSSMRAPMPARCRVPQGVLVLTVLCAIGVGAAALVTHPVLLIGAFVALVLLALD
jgi:hypothetical protein